MVTMVVGVSSARACRPVPPLSFRLRDISLDAVSAAKALAIF